MEITRNIASIRCELIIDRFEPFDQIVQKIIKHGINTVIVTPDHIESILNLRTLKQGNFRVYILLNYPIKNDYNLSDAILRQLDGVVIQIPKLKGKNEYYYQYQMIIQTIGEAFKYKTLYFVLPKDENAIDAITSLTTFPHQIQLTNNDLINYAKESIPKYIYTKPEKKLDKELLEKYKNDDHVMFNIYPEQLDDISDEL